MKRNIIFVFVIISISLFSGEVLLDVMFTNDIHGGIDRYPATFMNPNFPPMLGGGGSAASYIKDVRKYSDGKKRDNLLLDQGDFFQGHPVGTMTEGRSVITYMNMIGYDLSVVGNHEYDIGEEKLIETYSYAEFPILACNIYKKGTDELVDYVQPYIFLERLGIKFGIIGVTTTDTEKMSFPDNIKNVDFRSAKEGLEKYIPIVKEKGADIIFVCGHLGLPYEPEPAYQRRYSDDSQTKERYWGYDAQELAHEVEGIDVLFAGHMHKGFADPWEDPVTHTLVLQGYAYGSNVGHVILKFDTETRTLSGYEKPALREGVLITVFEDEFIPDEEIADTIMTMQKLAEKGMDSIIGYTEKHISKAGTGAQNAIGNLVCDAMTEATDADFSFLNLGGVRDELKLGPITYRDVFNVMPFENQVVTFNATGEYLKEIIEMRVSGSHHGLRVSGVKVVYNKTREDYDRVTELSIQGKPLQADKIYNICTTDFLMQGNAGLTMLTKIPESDIERYELNLRDVIADYIKNNSPVSAEIDDRWKRDDNSTVSRNLAEELEKKRKLP